MSHILETLLIVSPSTKFKKKFIQKCIVESFDKGSNDVDNIFTTNGKYSDESLESVMKKIDNENFYNELDTSKESSKTRENIINKMTNFSIH